MKRAIIMVLDSLGVGELPDAAKYGDAGSDTLGHIAEHAKNFHPQNLIDLGIGCIEGVNPAVPKTDAPKAVKKAAGDPATWKEAMNLIRGKDIQAWSFLSQGSIISCEGGHYQWTPARKEGAQPHHRGDVPVAQLAEHLKATARGTHARLHYP